MPATINPIRQSLLRKSLLQGKSIRQSMKDAGYSASTAHSNCGKDEPLVKACMKEIQRDIKKKITVEYVLGQIERIKRLAVSKEDFSTALASVVALGKWLAMFTEKTEPSTVENITMQFSIDRLQLIQIQSPTIPTT